MNLKLRLGTTFAAVIIAGSAFAQGLETEQQELGYIIGMDIGNSLRREGTDIDLDSLIEALRATYEGSELKLTTEEAATIRQNFITKRQAAMAEEQAAMQEDAKAQGAVNAVEGEAYLAENMGKEGVQVTDSGLQYKVLTMGTGAKPAATDNVEVHYRGTLLDGTEFDSSYSRNETASFQLDRVIAGWTEGVQLMPVGSKFEFYIKPDLAYGEAGGGPIPPNSTLIFEVELVSIGDAE